MSNNTNDLLSRRAPFAALPAPRSRVGAAVLALAGALITRGLPRAVPAAAGTGRQ